MRTFTIILGVIFGASYFLAVIGYLFWKATEGLRQ